MSVQWNSPAMAEVAGLRETLAELAQKSKSTEMDNVNRSELFWAMTLSLAWLAHVQELGC